jgi:SAM-dependent methyltransferase
MSRIEAPSQPVDDSFLYTGTELEGMAEARNYYKWILSFFVAHMGRQIIEVGAGTGTFTDHLLKSAPDSEIVAIEPAANLFPLLARRHAGNPRVKTIHGSLEENAASLRGDTIVLANVLEHIGNDEEYLRLLNSILHPGGHLLLFVPAVPWLYGSLDKEFEHFRRYTKPELRRKLANTGFQLKTIRYMNLPGVASWFIAGRVLRRRTLSANDVRFYDRWIVPWCSKIEKRWEPPVGQSLLAVASK